MAPFYTITPMQYRSTSFGERLALEIVGAAMCPLGDDQRMSVLMSVLGAQIIDMVETEDQIEALVDVLRVHLKLRLQDAAAEHQVRRA
jgi:hypothetical protein